MVLLRKRQKAKKRILLTQVRENQYHQEHQQERLQKVKGMMGGFDLVQSQTAQKDQKEQKEQSRSGTPAQPWMNLFGSSIYSTKCGNATHQRM